MGCSQSNLVMGISSLPRSSSLASLPSFSHHSHNDHNDHNDLKEDKEKEREKDRESISTLDPFESSSSEMFSTEFHCKLPLPLLSLIDCQVHYEIGEGSSGKIYCGKRVIKVLNPNGIEQEIEQDVAFKFFGYTDNQPNTLRIHEEMAIMSSLSNIDSFPVIYGYFLDPPSGIISGKIHHQIYPVIVMELLEGADLYEAIYERKIVSDERDLSRLFHSVVIALDEIHQKKFIHRDMKLENIMIVKTKTNHERNDVKESLGKENPEKESLEKENLEKESIEREKEQKDEPIKIKIVDCGSMVQLTTETDHIYRDFCVVGTPGYLAPESCQYFDYSFKSDLFQLGCCLYSILSGIPAFSCRDYHQNMSTSRYVPMTGPAWAGISSEAKDLVARLLHRSPDCRPSIQDILSHPWMTSQSSGTLLNDSYFSRVKYLALRQKMKRFFLDTDVLEKGRDRRKKLRKVIPLLRQMSTWSDSPHSSPRAYSPSDLVAPTPRTQAAFASISPEVFENKLQTFKGAVMKSFQPPTRKPSPDHSPRATKSKTQSSSSFQSSTSLQFGCLDYETFSKLMIESDLVCLSSRRVFHIFDINRTGIINIKDFLLTMAALQPSGGGRMSGSGGGSFRTKKWHTIVSTIPEITETNDSESGNGPGTVTGSTNSLWSVIGTGDDDERIQSLAKYYFDIFDLHNRGYIDMDQLKLSIGCFIDYDITMSSPQAETERRQSIGTVDDFNSSLNGSLNGSHGGSFLGTGTGSSEREKSSSSSQVNQVDIESLFQMMIEDVAGSLSSSTPSGQDGEGGAGDRAGAGQINLQQFTQFFKKLRQSS